MLVEHHVDLVMRVCDTVVVLDFGRVIASGDPASVRASAAVTKAYLGSLDGTAVDVTQDRLEVDVAALDSDASPASGPSDGDAEASAGGGRPMSDAMLEVDNLVAGYGGAPVLHASTSPCRPARSRRSSARTAPAKRLCSARCPGCCGRGVVGSSTTEPTSVASGVERIVRSGLAHVPENGGVITELTVHENLRLGGLWRDDRSDTTAAIDEVYELFPPLDARRKALGEALSGGERQMLAIGRALVARPRMLLLDEPSLGLAPRITTQIMTMLRQLCDTRGLTVLIVEQNTRAALSVADEGVVISLGRIVATCGCGDIGQRRVAAPRISGFLSVDAIAGSADRTDRPEGARVERFVFLTVDGLAHGAIYAAFALALVLIWRGTRVVNFAQGAMAVAAAYIAYSVVSATGNYWVGALAAIGAGLVLGVAVERGVMRFVAHTAPLSAIVVALGLESADRGGAGHRVRRRPATVPGAVQPDPIHDRQLLGLLAVHAVHLHRGGRDRDRDRHPVHPYVDRPADAGGGVRAGDVAAARR